MNHSFNTTLAERYGIEEAILIEHLYWWIHKNDCDEVEEMFQEGRIWCRFTAKGISKYIPYMNAHKIWRVIQGLEKIDKIKVGNFNKLATNHTSWYAFSDDFIKELKQLNYDFSKIKNRILKNEKSNNIIINNSIKENNIKEDNKRLSNDNQKVEYSEDFENFWKLYGYSKGKQRAYGKWNKLSDTDKQKAIDAIPAYLEDCARCKRDQQHAATYLFNHTFEDDFSAKPKRALYDPIDGEDEQKTRFKRWMRANYPEIEATALPLSYEDYMELIKGDHIEDVTNALTNIHNEIYKYRRSDIAQVIKAMLPKDDEEL